MKKGNESQNDNIDEEIKETSSEKIVPVALPIKAVKTPMFSNTRQFNKGNFSNTSNNRQRPGRAAGRGR